MIPPVVNRLISVRDLRAVAIKHLVELSVEHDFFFATFFLREKLFFFLLLFCCFFFFTLHSDVTATRQARL